MALWALKQGIPVEVGAFTVDSAHTTHYGVGYLTNQIKPRLGMVTHISFDRELIGEMVAGVRTHWKGMFAFGLDHTVVNVTKDAIWIRESAVPETGNIARPNPRWILNEYFGGQMPKEIAMPKPHFHAFANQEQAIRDLEIDPALFTPKDQMRKWVREWPTDLKINPAAMMGGAPPAKK